MGKFVDLTGRHFGRLTVMERSKNNKHNCVTWLCRCECGKTIVTRGDSLNSGRTLSCGCLSAEKTAQRNYKHGGIKTRLYHIWSAMIERCHNPNHKSYKNYGGRGVTVCDSWRTNFAIFQTWALVNGYRDGLTIDRINNNNSYNPDNCRWITHKDQQYNKRDNHLITFNGETHTLTEWAEITGINRNTLSARLNKLGWSAEKALTTPVKH